MSELRQNLASKEWVVIAPERQKKPNALLEKVMSHPVSCMEYASDCPFCPGNEEKYSVEEKQKVLDQDGRWLIKVIDNKYKILDAFDSCPALPGAFESEGIYQKLKGCGNHELVIETNKHNKTIVDLSTGEIGRILGVYRDRYLEFKKNPNNLLTTIFKNYGILAGQSQPHSHSQIVGSRVVPLYIRSLLHEAEKHFDNFGTCVFCDMIRFERSQDKRLVCENKDYIAFVPFAAGSEHETWIVPTWHSGGIAALRDDKLERLADIFQTVLKKFYHSIGNPDFNYVFRVAPIPCRIFLPITVISRYFHARRSSAALKGEQEFP